MTTKSSANDDINDDLHCKACQMNPCVWEEHCKSVMEECNEWRSEEAKSTGNTITNNLCRKFCYRQFSQIVDGFLGQGNRKKLPACIEKNVRRVFPNENGAQYMGFRSK